jgi:hypothetical protein
MRRIEQAGKRSVILLHRLSCTPGELEANFQPNTLILYGTLASQIRPHISLSPACLQLKPSPMDLKFISAANS